MKKFKKGQRVLLVGVIVSRSEDGNPGDYVVRILGSDKRHPLILPYVTKDEMVPFTGERKGD